MSTLCPRPTGRARRRFRYINKCLEIDLRELTRTLGARDVGLRSGVVEGDAEGAETRGGALATRGGDEVGVDAQTGHGFGCRTGWSDGGDLDGMKCARSCGGDEDVARAPAVAGVEGGGVGIVEVPHRAHVRRRKEQVAYGPIQRRLRRFWFRLEVVDGFVQIAVVGVARPRRDDVSRLGSPHARQAFANLPGTKCRLHARCNTKKMCNTKKQRILLDLFYSARAIPGIDYCTVINPTSYAG